MSLNVDQEIARMEKKIKFLDDWKQWSILQTDNLTMYQKKSCAELCISAITIRNTKLCIFGFLYYAKDLMNNFSQVKFVPYLHNNSST